MATSHRQNLEFCTGRPDNFEYASRPVLVAPWQLSRNCVPFTKNGDLSEFVAFRIL